MSQIFVNQTVRWEFTVTDQDDAIVDLSTAASNDLIFRKEDGSSFARSPTFITDGVDGQITYTSPINELDLQGKWKIQVLVIDAGGEEYPADIVAFSVQPRLVPA